MNLKQIEKISDLIFERLGLTDPKAATPENLVIALLLQTIIEPLHKAIVMFMMLNKDPNRIIELLRAIADALELVNQESNNDY